MGIIDKITGRAKKAAGDLLGDEELRRKGRLEEQKGEEKEKLARAHERVEDKAKAVSDLERRERATEAPKAGPPPSGTGSRP